MFGALRQDHAAHVTAEDACCLADKQDKLPSESKYKTIALDWMQFCSVSNKTDLLPVYHQLSNADKADHTTILRTAVRNQARTAGAAPTHSIILVVSKETKDMVLSCQFGVPTHKLHNLTAGLQPFAVGFFLGNNLGNTVKLRTNNNNLMLGGHTSPTDTIPSTLESLGSQSDET